MCSTKERQTCHQMNRVNPFSTTFITKSLVQQIIFFLLLMGQQGITKITHWLYSLWISVIEDSLNPSHIILQYGSLIPAIWQEFCFYKTTFEKNRSCVHTTAIRSTHNRYLAEFLFIHDVKIDGILSFKYWWKHSDKKLVNSDETSRRCIQKRHRIACKCKTYKHFILGHNLLGKVKTKTLINSVTTLAFFL